MPSTASFCRSGSAALAAVLVFGVLLLAPRPARAVERLTPSRALSFEERVAAQRAIEEVYWRHRIWPQENPGPKPPLSAVMSDDAIRAKVEDYLRKSNALETWWWRPATAAQLQAELDRMARDTRDPAMLRELHAALGNNPFLIAETLGRPTLVERLIRNWYTSDDRFHGEVRREAEAALAGARDVEDLKTLGGRYVERRVVRRGSGVQPAGMALEDARLILGDQEWSEWSQDLARQFGASSGSVPTGVLSPLQEDADRLFVTAVLSRGGAEVVVATVVWAKRPLEEWWSEVGTQATADLNPPAGRYTLSPVNDEGCAVGTWESRGFVAEGRREHVAVWTGTEMIVWGGEVTNSVTATGGRYRPSTDTWSRTSTGTDVPQARSSPTAVWTGTDMIIWGGSVSSTPLDTGGRYNPASDRWLPTSRGGNLPAIRANHTAVWTGTEMIIWGGSWAGGPLGTGGRYDPVSDSWTRTSTDPGVPAARVAHTAVWTGTEMIVWGGSSSGARLNSGGRYDPSTDRWTPTSTSTHVPEARASHTASWTGTELIVWGGHGSTHLNSGGRYSPSTDTWLPTSTGASVPVPRMSHTAVWTGTEMIVWGGQGDSGALLNTGARYSPLTDGWTSMSTGTDVPAARFLHTAVWTGVEMIVWGAGPFPGNTGGRYDPLLNRWTATFAGDGLMTQRSGHTAIWTGTEMIVWGGSIDSSNMKTGWRYFPSTGSVLPTSMSFHVPVERSQHAAVWTGLEMIVWGGAMDHLHPSPEHTGGRYNPSTNSWAATDLRSPHAPQGQRSTVAVWTGIEMIVWGGLTSHNSPTNQGSRLDPTIDSWTPTSPFAPVPTARYGHKGVWTGTELIIWGGYDGEHRNTGGRYDPLTNSWSATSTGPGTPSARSGHACVWSGTEMLVWGGGASNVDLPTSGGRYDPSADRWAAMPASAIAPEARFGHTTVWTGDEMIIWGGIAAGDRLNTGGRFDPATNRWVATSVGPSVPGTRSAHTAVWTGTEMIIHGGARWEEGIALYRPSGGAPTPDGDGDGVGLACDSCPDTFDPDQADVDLDGTGDVCDTCPSVSNGDQADFDEDGTGDVCDTCPSVSNGDQADFDEDGTGDVCESGGGLADADRSGRADGFDLAQLARAFGSCSGTSAYDATVDLDRSGCVEGLDLAILAEYFGHAGA